MARVSKSFGWAKSTVETYSLTQLRPREFVVKMSFDL